MSEHLDKARREHRATLDYEMMSPAESRLWRAMGDMLTHLEALEQRQPQMDAEGRVKVSPHQHPLSVAGVKYLTEEPEEVGTPSVSTSPSPSGIELSASADENLAEWLQRCPLPTTMGGFRLIVRPGSVTLWTSDGVGTLTIPTGTPEPPITSGSEQDEPGDPGPAPAAAECEHEFVRTPGDWLSTPTCWKCGAEQVWHSTAEQHPAASGAAGSFEMCNTYIFTDQVPGPQCMLQKGHRGFCSAPPRESRKEGTR